MLIPLVAIGALMVFGSGDDSADVSATATATLFELPTSKGTTASLEQALSESDVLLYFSMGVGCDGCFAQIPEVADALRARDITLMPVMVQDGELVNSVAQSWGIDEPILIDADLSVSEAYGMLGISGHTDRPFHSIALIKQDRTVALVKHYNTMFVEVADMMNDISLAG